MKWHYAVPTARLFAISFHGKECHWNPLQVKEPGSAGDKINSVANVTTSQIFDGFGY